MDAVLQVIALIFGILFWVVVFKYLIIPVCRFGAQNPETVKRVTQFLINTWRK